MGLGHVVEQICVHVQGSWGGGQLTDGGVGVGGQLTDGGVGPGQKPPPEFFPSSEGP